MVERRLPIIVGNWKMYKSPAEAVAYVHELLPLVKSASAKIYLAVPFTAISSVAEAAKGSNLQIGAQNMHDASEGAFTGEIAARMLGEAGASFVVLGHSERRRLFGETNDFINRKVLKALSEHLQPILCIGETLEEREAGRTADILHQQLKECLAGVSAENAPNLLIAYEPVWAIGTEKAAMPELAQQIHQECLDWLKEQLQLEPIILYGGSVNPANGRSLLEQPAIGGLLVGGASLSPTTFSEIINTAPNEPEE